MSYLLDFVKTFTPYEMQMFVHLDVIGREEIVRDIYVHHSFDVGFDESGLSRKLHISQSHFDSY